MKLQPVGTKERIVTLDVLRGFSLLGILLVNMFAFYLPMPHITDLSAWFTDVQDIILQQVLDIYVQSSFYPLFSMLFGYGVAMQFMKADGVGFYKFAPKRMIVLFVAGFLHAVLIWWGDILMTYAFCGLLLIALIKMRPLFLVICAFVLNGLFHSLILLGYFAMGIFSAPVEEASVDIAAIQNAITAYGVGTWGDTFTQRMLDLAVQFQPFMWVSAAFTILPYMLVGAAFAKWRLIERAREKIALWLILAVIGLGAGIFLKALPIYTTKTYGLEYVKVYVGGPILALGYMAVVVLLCLIPYARKLFSPIAKVGRMSMTLYIMQSIICTTLFYHWGFSLYGQVDVQMGIIIAVAIYVVQLILAELWLSKFTQGPLELAIKRATYGKILSEK